MKIRGIFAIGIFLLTVLPVSGRLLIPFSGNWKFFKGTEEASSPNNAAWRRVDFDDRAWGLRASPFHYGEARIQGGTVLNDMRYSYSTLFLRRSVHISDASTVGSLTFSLDYDDAFILWINGKEALRVNFNGSPQFNSFASAGHESGTIESFLILDSQQFLVSGENLVAVQMFNVNLTSSDLVFDLKMESTEPDRTPPRVNSMVPGPGDLNSLDGITVFFSEPVLGVKATSLLLNDQPASRITNAGNSFTFYYDFFDGGTASFNWDPRHQITDTATPSNAFDDKVAGGPFVYRIIDRIAPGIMEITPPPGAELRGLAEIIIRFTEPIINLDAADLLINDQPAIGLIGDSLGPYVFQLPELPAGSVQIQWVNNHDIVDLGNPPNPLQPQDWSYVLSPDTPLPFVRINELSAVNSSRTPNALTDDDGDAEDWIEIYNGESRVVSLAGWSLSDNSEIPGRWVFPSVEIQPDDYLIVFASGKNRKNGSVRLGMHTNFKLAPEGEFLGLFDNSSPRNLVSQVSEKIGDSRVIEAETPAFVKYPPQRSGFSYGLNQDNIWGYFERQTAGRANTGRLIGGLMPSPHFSVQRGVFRQGFRLHLSSEDPTGTVRFTTDGSAPGPANGRDYKVPISIGGTRIIRAATFKAGALPSSVVTHSYILGQSTARRSLPVLSVVTDNDNLWGRTGIMEISPRNTSKRGIAWERPASVEFMFPEKEGGFALNCGLRIQGGNYVRDRYNPNGSLPFSKYSFRLYFRSDYGASKLVYPFFDIPVAEYDRIVLRAGMNDHSNPFISDELVRRLCADTGQVSSHGNLVNFFLNGEYQGYYNPTERIDSAFLQSWHGGGEEWDVMAQFNEVREGSRTSWDSLLRTIDRSNFRVGSSYEKVSGILDIQNFIDYLLVNVFVATGDWPHNNWRAARERVEGAKWRFYVWDAEWSFGFRNSVNHNTFTNELASNTEIGRMYRRLRGSEEFRLKFADRIQKHFFNGGALSREHVTERYLELKNELRGMLPRPSRNVPSTWVPSRQTRIWPHFEAEGLLAEVATPTFSIPSGRLAQGVDLSLDTDQGIIYYTMDGTDPRVPISGAISATAVSHRTGQDRLFLDRSMVIKMRTLDGVKWSALNEATYQVATLGSPIKITELMYHPAGSEALEFIELKNTSEAAVDLSGYSISGVNFSMPEGTVLEGGKFLLLASDADPDLFLARYPRSRVFGYYAGSLSNSGESIKLLNREGNPFLVLDYRDGNGWPKEADGEGFSLQIVNEVENPGNPGNWTRSREIGGSPGKDGLPIVMNSVIRLNEIMAFNRASVSNGGENPESFPDWVELYNAGNEAVSLEGWGLSDEGQPAKFTFGSDSVLEAGEYLVVWFDNRTALEGIHSGFGLNKDGDQLFLLNPEGQIVDQSVFGNQLEDLSIGRLSGLPREAWVLNQPTPGEVNRGAVTAPLRSIRLNEWQSSPVSGDEDWVELYNRDEEHAVDLHGIFIGNDDVYQQISIPTFIEPKGHLVFTADQSSRPGHLIFKLPSQSSMITVFRPNGSEIDRIQITNQPKGVSTGRLPDGSNTIRNFTRTSSRGAPNFEPADSGLQLNEILAVGPFINGSHQDWLEIFNSSDQPRDLTGMHIDLDLPELDPWFFPDGFILDPGAYQVVLCDDSDRALNPEIQNLGHSLPDDSGRISILDSEGLILDSVEYGFQVKGLSIGRLSATNWFLQEEPTPGQSNSGNRILAAQSSLHFNEWMANDPEGPDWFELYNASDLPVALTNLYFSDDPSYKGANQFQVGPLSFIDAGGWVQWIADGNVQKGNNHVGFRLDQLGESLLMYRGAAGARIEMVDFGAQTAGVSTGRLPDGANFFSQLDVPTPGFSNVVIVGVDSDGDGLPDDWEIVHGFDPSDSSDAGLDFDGDFLNNLGEFLSGTDPLDAQSTFSVQAGKNQSLNIVIRFDVMPERAYRVEFRDNINEGNWNLLIELSAVAEKETAEIQDPLPTGSGHRFYRVVLKKE